MRQIPWRAGKVECINFASSTNANAADFSSRIMSPLVADLSLRRCTARVSLDAIRIAAVIHGADCQNNSLNSIASPEREAAARNVRFSLSLSLIESINAKMRNAALILPAKVRSHLVSLQ